MWRPMSAHTLGKHASAFMCTRDLFVPKVHSRFSSNSKKENKSERNESKWKDFAGIYDKIGIKVLFTTSFHEQNQVVVFFL